MITLGSEVKDTVTGLVGIATCRLEYMNGCERYEIQPQGLTKDGAPKESKWVDVQQIEVLETAEEQKEQVKTESKPGGDRCAPPNMSTP